MLPGADAVTNGIRSDGELEAHRPLGQFTCWTTEPDDVRDVESLGVYVAVTVWLPRLKLLFENEACPALRVRVARTVVPSRKVTVPVGVPKLEVTVAVKVTDWLKVDGLRELLTLVVVERPLTVWVSVRVDVAQVLFPV